ncbi:T9SS type A sorting domain-containing protein [Hymenobacter terrenus]|uniref:T9SS type A sorting domain-containing protein n=1 Tax=Hymenobacter terrenus TaxID=1629124 RepID=UPI00069627D0|nr:T9SS type A sorting domain-containing protein [Hymenobacter terrenus]
MQVFTSPSVSYLFAQFRTLLVGAIILSLGIGHAGAAPIYSNNGQVYTPNPYSYTSFAGIILTESGIRYPERAADSDLKNYAIVNSGLSVASVMRLQLGLNTTTGGKAGDRAGVLVGTFNTLGNALNINALGAITLRTYSGGLLREAKIVSAEVARDILLNNERPTQLEFIAGQNFDRIDIEVGGLAGVSYKLKVYYAYVVPALVKRPVRGLASRFAGSGTALDSYYRAGVSPTPGIVSACLNTGVLAPGNAVSSDMTDYASFASTATVACPAALAVKLEGMRTAPAGYYAGFVVGGAGVLDLNALSGIRLTTYRNGVPQESATGQGLLDLKLLPDGQSQVSFPTTQAFDEVRIERLGTLSVLDNLKIYYGFGVEPTAFQGTTRILSNFGMTTAPSKYSVNVNAGVCAACSITNAAGAADNDASTKAVLNVPVGVLSNVELKLDLNGAGGGNVGVAGYRAGMVISNNQGLVDAGVLQNLTLTTYDASGNLLESASGASLLGLNLLPDGKQEVSFLTTQDFASVQLSVTGVLGAALNLSVYQAFADNFAGAQFANITPLPVELTAFKGRWTNGAAELSWNTASEKNSSYFLVERSTGGDATFRSVGQVNAAGNSSSPLNYKLRDAEASAQGVSMLYYRLRQVDLDGKQVFSQVISLAVGKQEAVAPQLELYPNPAPDAQAVMVHFTNLPTTGGTVQTYSQLGQLVSQLPVTGATANLALPALTPGLYHVVLRDAAGQSLTTQRLVVGGR